MRQGRVAAPPCPHFGREDVGVKAPEITVEGPVADLTIDKGHGVVLAAEGQEAEKLMRTEVRRAGMREQSQGLLSDGGARATAAGCVDEVVGGARASGDAEEDEGVLRADEPGSGLLLVAALPETGPMPTASGRRYRPETVGIDLCRRQPSA